MSKNTNRKRNKKKTRWSPDDEDCLLDLWAANIDKLSGSRRNGNVYKEMADEMKKWGKTFSPCEVKFKVHNLTNKYKKEKLQMEMLGIANDWPPFQKIHAILGNFSDLKEETIAAVEGLEDDLSIESECKYSEVLTKPVIPASATHSDEASSSGISGNSRKPAKRKKKTVFDKIMDECKKTNSTIIEERNHVRTVDIQMLNIEQERNDILKEFVANSKRFQDNITHMLKRIN